MTVLLELSHVSKKFGAVAAVMISTLFGGRLTDVKLPVTVGSVVKFVFKTRVDAVPSWL